MNGLPVAGPSNSTAEQRHTGSLPAEQQPPPPPSAAYQLRRETASTDQHQEPAPASYYTATSRSAAQDLYEGIRQAQTALQQFAPPFGSHHHAEVCFAHRFPHSLLVELHHVTCQAPPPNLQRCVMLSSTYTPTSRCCRRSLCRWCRRRLPMLMMPCGGFGTMQHSRGCRIPLLSLDLIGRCRSPSAA